MNLLSDASRAPSSEPICAIARKSVLLKTLLSLSELNILVTNWQSQMIGERTFNTISRLRTVKGASPLQFLAPIVLGIISDRINIAAVIRAGTTKTVDEKLKRARDLLLDLSISKDEYTEIKAELEVERHNIDVKLQSLSKADDSFNQTIGIIFELASKAHELFKSSEIEEKRRIITLLIISELKNGWQNAHFYAQKPV
jgi:hypothetical protein